MKNLLKIVVNGILIVLIGYAIIWFCVALSKTITKPYLDKIKTEQTK